MNLRWPLIVLGLVACSSAPDVEPGIDDQWAPEEGEDQGDATLNPVLPGRAPKRLTVEQLRAIAPQVTDGHTWNQSQGFAGYEIHFPMFDLMGPSMGEADYIITSVNFLDPIPSFMKYVDEMASQVCLETLAEVGNDSIVRYEDVDENLRFLRLKLHGIYVPPDSTEGLGELRALYDGLYAQYSEQPPPYTLVPWLGVCVAMMTDPEFYIY